MDAVQCLIDSENRSTTPELRSRSHLPLVNHKRGTLEVMHHAGDKLETRSVIRTSTAVSKDFVLHVIYTKL